MEIATWIATIVSMIGSVLNARGKISGFYFWMVANYMYVFMNLRWGLYAQSALFAFNFIICMVGVMSWTFKKRKEETPEKEKV